VRRALWQACAAALRLAAAGTFIAPATFLSVAVAQSPAPADIPGRTAPEALNGASLELFPREHLFRVLGREVISATGEGMGRIVDVLFDEKGAPRAAVIDFGGFLGVGTRKIAIGWSVLRFDLGEKRNIIALEIGRDQLKAAPEYKDSDKPIPVVAPPQPTPAPNQPTPDTGR
jgi:hypothetical protein